MSQWMMHMAALLISMVTTIDLCFVMVCQGFYYGLI